MAQFAEAFALRDAGLTTRLLTWLSVPGADFAGAVERDIDLSASAPWVLDEIAAAASGARPHRAGPPQGRHGPGPRGRLRPRLDHARASTRAALEAEGAVRVVGVWTHFAHADSPEHPTVLAQQERFFEAVTEAERAGLRPEVRHLANSAATLVHPSAHADLVRPGIAMYGLTPVPQVDDDFGLRPVMTLRARLALVKALPAGQGISYGHAYVPDVDTVVGLVPAGYADGVPRNATNVGPLLVDGPRTTIAGRVCMDQFVVDLGPDSPARAGDVVTLFGGAPGEPTAQDWADATDTISYEIVTRLGARVPRIYVGAPGARRMSPRRNPRHRHRRRHPRGRGRCGRGHRRRPGGQAPRRDGGARDARAARHHARRGARRAHRRRGPAPRRDRPSGRGGRA